MTTASSPLSALTLQADRIAKTLKQIERGETVMEDVGGKIAASRSNPSVTFGVFMDDKIIKIEMRWDVIRETSERGISDFILREMKKEAE